MHFVNDVLKVIWGLVAGYMTLQGYNQSPGPPTWASVAMTWWEEYPKPDIQLERASGDGNCGSFVVVVFVSLSAFQVDHDPVDVWSHSIGNFMNSASISYVASSK